MHLRKIVIIGFITCLFLLTSCGKKEPEVVGSITLNETEITITNDESSSRVIFATLTDIKGEVTWHSSHSDIVSVSADSDTKVARIKGHKTGMAIITALIGDLVAECRVTVNEGAYLRVSKTRVDLAVGKTESLYVESNESELTYTSSNEGVATVNQDGLITAISDGTSIITIKSTTKTIYVHVYVDFEGVSFLEQEDIILRPENNEATLTAIGKGGVDILSGVWSIDDNVLDAEINGQMISIKAKSLDEFLTTTISFSVIGYPTITKTITIKPEDISLEVSPLYGTFLAKETTYTITHTITPIQPEDKNKVDYVVSIEGIIQIEEGIVTRDPSYEYSEDQVSLTITVIPLIDPEAKQIINLIVENPLKGLKFITDIASFDKVMTQANNDSIIYLMNDIDLEGRVYNGQIMSGDFSGHFHGNGYTISNFTASGVFGSIIGTVENLSIKGNMIGSQRGFLAFHITGKVQNIFIDVTFKKPSQYVGGLALVVNSSDVSNLIILARNKETIQVDMVYGACVQRGNLTDVILYKEGSLNNGGSGINVVSEAQLINRDTYANFDETIWNIVNGEVPYLIKQGE